MLRGVQDRIFVQLWSDFGISPLGAVQVAVEIGGERRVAVSDDAGTVEFKGVAAGVYLLEIGDGYFEVASVPEDETAIDVAIPFEVIKEWREATGETRETPEGETPDEVDAKGARQEPDVEEGDERGDLGAFDEVLSFSDEAAPRVWWDKPELEVMEDAPLAFGGETTRFAVTIKPQRGTDARDKANTSLRVALTRANRGDSVAYHTETPDTADCYLQIWEIDYFFPRKRYNPANDAQLQARENRLLAVVPGFVLRSGSRYTFHAAGEPTLRFSAADGPSLGFHLEGVDSPVSVPVGEREGVAEFAAALVNAADDESMRERQRPTRIVHFVDPELRRQISEYGGISVAFVADYHYATAGSNEQEFKRQALAMIGTRAAFVLDGGRVRYGINIINSYTQIAPKLAALASAVMEALGLASPPKISTLMLYAHGFPNAMKIDRTYRAPGSLRTERVQDFVDGVKSQLSERCVVTLYACSTGRGGRPSRTGKQAGRLYGYAAPGEPLGADSLAWTLARTLEAVGLRHATVWAHTTAAHVTRNSRLRVFSPYGDADFVGLLGGSRSVSERYKRKYSRLFSGKKYSNNKVAYFDQLERQNVLRWMHLLSARYLPWPAVGRPAVEHDDTLDRPGARSECTAIIEHYRGIIGEADSANGGFEYDEDGSAIVGPSVASGLEVSAHFEYSEFLSLGAVLPLPLRLVQGLELLRQRWRGPLNVTGFAAGDGVGARALSIAPVGGGDGGASLIDVARTVAALGCYFERAYTDASDVVWISMDPATPAVS